MAQKRYLLIVLVAIVMAVSVQQAFGLKCWSCDSIQDPQCSDPFSGDKSPELSKIECSRNQGGTGVVGSAGCLKVVMKEKILRQCTNSEEEAKKTCNEYKEVSSFCESCNDADGCNGAPQYGPVMMLIAIPVVLLMKMSSI